MPERVVVRVKSEKVYKTDLDFWGIAIAAILMEHGSNNQATALSYCPPPPWEQPSLLPALARGFLQICNSLPLDFSSCHPTSSPLLPAVPQDLRCPVASAYCLSSVALWLYSTTSAPTQLSLLELS